MNSQALLIALMATIISPSILAVITHWLTSRARRAEKRLDWQREDELETKKAKKAEEAARLLLAANERVAKTAEVTNGKLDQIHTLVNSNMTAAMKSELEATIEKLRFMRKDVARDRADKIKVLPEALLAIKNVELRIGELEATLNDRLKQTLLAESALQT